MYGWRSYAKFGMTASTAWINTCKKLKTTMHNTMEKPADRELRISRTFKAPIELMWKVWTHPEHIGTWWGPDGFTCTVHQMDVREGGEWKLTLHGPDRKDYANHSVFKEIAPLKKIVFEHFNPSFTTTVLFEAKGDETLVDWCMEFETAEMREIVVKAHKADEGLRQNMDKLERYIEGL